MVTHCHIQHSQYDYVGRFLLTSLHSCSNISIAHVIHIQSLGPDVLLRGAASCRTRWNLPRVFSPTPWPPHTWLTAERRGPSFGAPRLLTGHPVLMSAIQQEFSAHLDAKNQVTAARWNLLFRFLSPFFRLYPHTHTHTKHTHVFTSTSQLSSAVTSDEAGGGFHTPRVFMSCMHIAHSCSG